MVTLKELYMQDFQKSVKAAKDGIKLQNSLIQNTQAELDAASKVRDNILDSMDNGPAAMFYAIKDNCLLKPEIISDIQRTLDSDRPTLETRQIDAIEKSAATTLEYFRNKTMTLEGSIGMFKKTIQVAEGSLKQAIQTGLAPAMYEEISSQLKGQEPEERQSMIYRIVERNMIELNIIKLDANDALKPEDHDKIKNIAAEIDEKMQSRKADPIKSFGDAVRHFVAAITGDKDYLLKNSATTEKRIEGVIKKSFSERIETERNEAEKSGGKLER